MQIRTLLQQLKLLSPLRLLIFLGLLFIGPNITAQTDPTVPTETKNQIQNQIQEEHDTKNLDKLLIDYNKDSEKVLKDASKIIQKDESSELTKSELDVGQNDNPDDELLVKKTDLSMFDLHKKKIDPKGLKKIKYSEALKVTLGPLQKMSERELIQLLRDNTKGSSAEDYINRFPKLVLFTVRLIKDKEAIPSMARILDDQDRLIRFTGIMLATILFAFLLKRFMKEEGRSIAKALGLWFLRFLIISALRFAILLYFFSAELGPVFKVASKTFF